MYAKTRKTSQAEEQKMSCKNVGTNLFAASGKKQFIDFYFSEAMVPNNSSLIHINSLFTSLGEAATVPSDIGS